MAVPNTVSGKVGKALIGVIPITITRWEVNDDADDLDQTTAEDDGFGVADIGVEQLSGTLEINYVVGASKIAPMRPQRGTGLKLYTYKILTDVGPFWDVPNFSIYGFRQTSEVRGKITGTCRFKSRGTFTAPVDPS